MAGIELQMTSFKRHLTGPVSFAKKDMLPAVLYHYTTASGFAGIVGEFSIRATNLSYLNDPSELEYGRKVVERTLRREIVKNVGVAASLLEEAAVALDASVVAEVYVACFTLLKDNLAQWRAYGTAAGERYAIGFNPGVLQDASFAVPEARLTKVTYGGSAQVQRVQRVLRRATEFVVREKVAIRGVSPYAIETARRLAQLLPALKTREYSIEKEWRVVITRAATDAAEIQFDTRRGIVRPYFPFKFRTDRESGILSLHVLAPAHREASLKAANLVLRRAEITNVQAKHSRVPFAD